MARAGLLDVPGDERRPAGAGRALRLDLQPQFRGAAGAGRAHASGQPGDGGGGGDRRAFCRCDADVSESGSELHEKIYSLLDGLVAPLDRANVDTDAIIPKQFLKSIKRSGFGPNLFDEWRYLDHGEPGMDNSKRPLNPGFRAEPAALSRRADPAGAREFRLRLVARTRAVGAGRLRFSRHHRAQLCRHLFQQLFQERPVADPPGCRQQVDELFKAVAANAGYKLAIDLERQTVSAPDGKAYKFEVEAFRKHCLLNGLDDIGLTLQHADEIKAYEAKHRAAQPWLYAD